MTTLNIAHNKRIFLRLAAGDETAVADLILRATQNDCDQIALPSEISEEFFKALDADVGIRVRRVNYKITAEDIKKTKEYLARDKARNAKISAFSPNRSGSKTRTKRTPVQQAAHKRERAEKDREFRARCKGASAKKP